MAAGTKARTKKGPKPAPVEAPKPSFLEQVQTAPKRFRAYVDELRREMKLVTWPGREQVRATTVVVLVTVFVFAIFFGVVDYVLAYGQTMLYQTFLP